MPDETKPKKTKVSFMADDAILVRLKSAAANDGRSVDKYLAKFVAAHLAKLPKDNLNG